MGQFILDPNKNKCPDCGSKCVDIDYLRGEEVCSSCGFVINESKIDHGPEWRKFRDIGEPDRARTGPPINNLKEDSFPRTYIRNPEKDYYGRSNPHQNQAQIYRLRKWQRRIIKYNTKSKNVQYGYSEIDRVCTSKDLPYVARECAKALFKKASDRNLILGRSLECTIAAVIYAACKFLEVPRSLNEINDGFNINRNEIGRAYRKITRELEISINLTSPSDFIPRFSSKLQMDRTTIDHALKITKKIETMLNISGKDPAGIAASSLYIASFITGKTRTQQEISRVSGISEVTIRKRYKELIKLLKIEVEMKHFDNIFKNNNELTS